MGSKKAVNVSIQSDLLEAARAADINISATLEAALTDQLRIRKRERWRADNAEAVPGSNALRRYDFALAMNSNSAGRRSSPPNLLIRPNIGH
jgi:post-segregation antitoxin (ccd killing protein)